MVSLFSTQRIRVDPLRILMKSWKPSYGPDSLPLEGAVEELEFVIAADDCDLCRWCRRWAVGILLGCQDVVQGCGLTMARRRRWLPVRERSDQVVPSAAPMVEQLMIAVVVVAVAWKAVGGRRRIRERLDVVEQVADLHVLIFSRELIDGVVDGKGWLLVLAGKIVQINLDGAGRERGKDPTTADADVNNHINTPTQHTVSLESQVIHEGVDVHT
jgi:hypothetical protein